MNARALRPVGAAHRYLGPQLGLAACFALALPACPLSDEYYVDSALGRGGNAGGTAASAGQGGSAEALGGTLGADGGSSGNTGASGGTDAAGGTGNAGGTDAAGGTGNAGGTDATGGTGNAAQGGSGGDIGTGGAGCIPTAEVCDGISNDCDDEIDEDGVCPTGCTARIFDQRTYLLCLPAPAERLQHLAAGQQCTAFGQQAGLAVPSDLTFVAVESEDENNFVKGWLDEVATEGGVVWMGATDVREEDIWVWGRGIAVEVQFFTGNGSGGTPYMGRYNDFASGEPHGATSADGIDCAGFDSSVNWQWVDLSCTEEIIGFICESGQ